MAKGDAPDFKPFKLSERTAFSHRKNGFFYQNKRLILAAPLFVAFLFGRLV